MNTDYSDIDEEVISGAIFWALQILLALLVIGIFLSPILWS